MIELTSVLFILLLFVFPLPVFAASLGLFTTWNLYKKYSSFKAQPTEGKKNLILSAVLFLINFICSIFLGVTLSFAVHYFIFDNIYLFIFNFLFCSTISLRWFDFTHNIYRLFIFKLKPKDTSIKSHFAICQGFRGRDGFGLTPVYTDAGTLRLEGNQLVFKGVFREEKFAPTNITHIEKKSSEKLRIFSKSNNFNNIEVFLITLKEKFYPFKSRQDRDHIFEKLSAQIKPAP
jgi:hypothetical protein